MTSSIKNYLQPCTDYLNDKFYRVRYLITHERINHPSFRRLLWIPGIAPIVVIWRAYVISGELTEERRRRSGNHPSTTHEACIPEYARLQRLISVAKLPMTVDIALVLVAKAVLAATFPLFSTFLLYLAIGSIVGRVFIAIGCYGELAPYREGLRQGLKESKGLAALTGAPRGWYPTIEEIYKDNNSFYL